MDLPHPLPDPLIELIAQRLRVVGELMRIKLVDQLRDGDPTVQELADRVGAVRQNVSKHLGAYIGLESSSGARSETNVSYTLADPAALELLETAAKSLAHQLAALNGSTQMECPASGDMGVSTGPVGPEGGCLLLPGRGVGRLFEPDLAAEPDRDIRCGVGLQHGVECAHEPSDSVAVEPKAPGHADESVGLGACPKGLGEQRAEVAEVSGDDRALLVRQRCEVDAVRATLEIRAFADGDNVVAAVSQLAGDLGREVLVEQQLQLENASRAARHLVSSRALCARTRPIQASISSRLEP